MKAISGKSRDVQAGKYNGELDKDRLTGLLITNVTWGCQQEFLPKEVGIACLRSLYTVIVVKHSSKRAQNPSVSGWQLRNRVQRPHYITFFKKISIFVIFSKNSKKWKNNTNTNIY